MIHIEVLKICRDALDKLSRLGNGDCRGNSVGNDIAIAAYDATTDIEQPEVAMGSSIDSNAFGTLVSEWASVPDQRMGHAEWDRITNHIDEHCAQQVAAARAKLDAERVSDLMAAINTFDTMETSAQLAARIEPQTNWNHAMSSAAHVYANDPIALQCLDYLQAVVDSRANQPAVDVEALQIDLAWHKEALSRHTAKLESVWAGIAEAVTKATGRPCGDEPLSDLNAALAARIEPDEPVAWARRHPDGDDDLPRHQYRAMIGAAPLPPAIRFDTAGLDAHFPGFREMVLCPTCGNKRCPHASDPANVCAGSNEPGQLGSAYPKTDWSAS